MKVDTFGIFNWPIFQNHHSQNFQQWLHLKADQGFCTTKGIVTQSIFVPGYLSHIQAYQKESKAEKDL